jgi:hypothetical protein
MRHSEKERSSLCSLHMEGSLKYYRGFGLLCLIYCSFFYDVTKLSGDVRRLALLQLLIGFTERSK